MKSENKALWAAVLGHGQCECSHCRSTGPCIRTFSSTGVQTTQQQPDGPHARRTRGVADERLLDLTGALQRYVTWLDGGAWTDLDWPEGVLPCVDELRHRAGGAFALAVTLTRGKREEAHIADHALAVFLAIKTAEDTPQAQRDGLRSAIARTRTQYECSNSQKYSQCALWDLLSALVLREGVCLQDFTGAAGAAEGVLKRLLITAFVAADAYARAPRLLLAQLGTENRSEFLCGGRGERALRHLLHLFLLHRGGPFRAWGELRSPEPKWCRGVAEAG